MRRAHGRTPEQLADSVLQHNTLGVQQLQQENFDISLESFLRAEELIEALDSSLGPSTWTGKGTSFERSEAAVALSGLRSMTFNNLGCYYTRVNDMHSALQYLNLAIQEQKLAIDSARNARSMQQQQLKEERYRAGGGNGGRVMGMGPEDEDAIRRVAAQADARRIEAKAGRSPRRSGALQEALVALKLYEKAAKMTLTHAQGRGSSESRARRKVVVLSSMAMCHHVAGEMLVAMGSSEEGLEHFRAGKALVSGRLSSDAPVCRILDQDLIACSTQNAAVVGGKEKNSKGGGADRLGVNQVPSPSLFQHASPKAENGVVVLRRDSKDSKDREERQRAKVAHGRGSRPAEEAPTPNIGWLSARTESPSPPPGGALAPAPLCPSSPSASAPSPSPDLSLLAVSYLTTPPSKRQHPQRDGERGRARIHDLRGGEGVGLDEGYRGREREEVGRDRDRHGHGPSHSHSNSHSHIGLLCRVRFLQEQLKAAEREKHKWKQEAQEARKKRDEVEARLSAQAGDSLNKNKVEELEKKLEDYSQEFERARQRERELVKERDYLLTRLESLEASEAVLRAKEREHEAEKEKEAAKGREREKEKEEEKEKAQEVTREEYEKLMKELALLKGEVQASNKEKEREDPADSSPQRRVVHWRRSQPQAGGDNGGATATSSPGVNSSAPVPSRSPSASAGRNAPAEAATSTGRGGQGATRRSASMGGPSGRHPNSFGGGQRGGGSGGVAASPSYVLPPKQQLRQGGSPSQRAR
uniref:Uncharacterized protein n=1 Tax=Chromera velia CCMP2878 TaxID=1169474 RepID=A0A0G4GC44_9ALVE|eukprot:Cvel_21225.t1-p1 / transcript=Cvel_21225.t1 / gene=Cvel_21225 / organism=Chromera_velia_CCMP2878 / gene_product=hypothetical protein / transcript_product=hypothetical protein / location=Cvel_scaffold1973:2483-6693(-) / protein_length=756 / sequence_SO=supercontig / SO=protein_coding / is_pseudo=false